MHHRSELGSNKEKNSIKILITIIGMSVGYLWVLLEMGLGTIFKDLFITFDIRGQESLSRGICVLGGFFLRRTLNYVLAAYKYKILICVRCGFFVGKRR